MTDNSESTFQPHSDEELARLLEEQMRAMRSAQPITAPQPVAAFTSEPVAPAAGEELGIDDLFGALLEDTTDIPVVQEIVVEEIFVPSVDESTLEHTQPITYVHEDVVEAAVVEDHIIVEETVVEAVIEDAHVIAERVLSEISIDGEIVATTISETAGSDPIPQMFGEAVVSEPVAAPVFAASMSYTPEPAIFDEVRVEDEVVEDVIVEEVVVEEFEAPQLRSTNPINHINSFAPRPSFDELVFGVKSDD
ncbi:hypothetical protein M2118_001232 [Aurantimicrobium minutum]|uniref:hypothetical protein n=1 Tax=Aurantimicrobium minutum TaxID=708131 RepID=UPI002476BDF0|nr:hypothetical protein [Aurantimicrobium minutum]MDH6278255.1 hypothetical protein [Aurantimicrobium minutum]